MRKFLLILMGAIFSFPSALPAQSDKITPSGVPEFLAHYEESLGPVDQAFEDLSNENLPLRDEAGQPLGRRHIEDRRQTLTLLRQTVRRLASSPQDLVLTTNLVVQTEALVDDLFDLSQVAYDNDREEMGKRFSDLEASMGQTHDLLETYVLSLALTKQDRLQELERENQDLQQKLKQATERLEKVLHH
jgi:hypothetical protein